ncbi:hypothetical protein GCM10010430_49890 [Kitasatospora cystarginea]|uniref:Uncharacterized protein n=1 Tax=Kitasatospora cystarginea TaxID=58350 RepID=A0ABP5RIR0_9ACTN
MCCGRGGLIITEGTYIGHPAAGDNDRVPAFLGDDAFHGAVGGVHQGPVGCGRPGAGEVEDRGGEDGDGASVGVDDAADSLRVGVGDVVVQTVRVGPGRGCSGGWRTPDL